MNAIQQAAAADRLRRRLSGRRSAGGQAAELESLLGRPVQVVTERGLDQLLRDRVLQEAVPL